MIPPGVERFVVDSYCTANATQVCVSSFYWTLRKSMCCRVFQKKESQFFLLSHMLTCKVERSGRKSFEIKLPSNIYSTESHLISIINIKTDFHHRSNSIQYASSLSYRIVYMIVIGWRTSYAMYLQHNEQKRDNSSKLLQSDWCIFLFSFTVGWRGHQRRNVFAHVYLLSSSEHFVCLFNKTIEWSLDECDEQVDG